MDTRLAYGMDKPAPGMTTHIAPFEHHGIPRPMIGAGPTSVDLKKVLAGAQLPALPQSAIRLLELSQDPANGPHEFAAPIEADPGLTGQVLRFVNSSYFGFSRLMSSK